MTLTIFTQAITGADVFDGSFLGGGGKYPVMELYTLAFR